MWGLGPAVARILRERWAAPAGKGFLASRIASELEERGLRVALLSVDPWLRLPGERFHPWRPAEHFYEHGLRLDEMFQSLVLPLRSRRSLTVDMDYAGETAAVWRRHTWPFEEVDLILLEEIPLWSAPSPAAGKASPSAAPSPRTTPFISPRSGSTSSATILAPRRPPCSTTTRAWPSPPRRPRRAAPPGKRPSLPEKG